MRTLAMALTLLVSGFFAMPTAWAQTSGDKEHAELTQALKDARVPLQRGLNLRAAFLFRRWMRVTATMMLR